MASRHNRPASEDATLVVRLFPDYAGTVVWFVGPVAYDDTRLDPDLVADLQAWEGFYYAGLTFQHAWRSPAVEADYYSSGARLARRVADQIGDRFLVEHDLARGRRRVRAAGPPRNPEAAAAFCRMADLARAGSTPDENPLD